jgi:hypothetical protein
LSCSARFMSAELERVSRDILQPKIDRPYR